MVSTIKQQSTTAFEVKHFQGYFVTPVPGCTRPTATEQIFIWLAGIYVAYVGRLPIYLAVRLVVCLSVVCICLSAICLSVCLCRTPPRVGGAAVRRSAPRQCGLSDTAQSLSCPPLSFSPPHVLRGRGRRRRVWRVTTSGDGRHSVRSHVNCR